MKQEILLIGTDARFAPLFDLLHGAGWILRCHQVCQHPDDFFPASSFDEIRAVVLPLPSLLPDGSIRGTDAPKVFWEQLISVVPASIPIFGGMLPKTPGHELCDLLGDEVFALKNALLTAEGATEILMNRAAPLQAKRVLITGFGRIASLLAPRLRAMGMEVSILARRPEVRAKCELSGFSLYRGTLSDYDVIINTVPAEVFSAEDLETVRKGCFLLELASAPGGFSPEGSRLHPVLKAPGIPASYAPHAAAQAEFDAILRTLEGGDGI